MSEEEWRLEVSGIMGEVKNELENNRINHKKVNECLRGVQDALAGLPCTEHTTALATIKTKFSKPYLIGALVIALLPISFLGWKVRDIQKEFIKDTVAIHKTQTILERFIKESGYIVKSDSNINHIEGKGGNKSGE